MAGCEHKNDLPKELTALASLNFFSEKVKRENLNAAVGITAKTDGWLNDPSQWEVIRAIVDSGATVPVIHPSTGQGYEVLDSEASKAGVEYEIANGGVLANLGKKMIAVLTAEGTVRGYQSECADVSKSLQSVRSLVKNQHAVLFGLGENGDQNLIVNKISGEINWMEDDGVNYIQKLLVIPPSKVEEVREQAEQARHESGQHPETFQGPGS